jgi:competence protein ComEC
MIPNKKIKKFFILILYILPAIVLGFVGVSGAQVVTWTMINVNSGDQQGDAHLIEFSDGQVYLLDVGFESDLVVNYLKKRNIKKIDKVIISHFHKDHYGGLFSLLKAKISIKKVYANLPPQDVCDSEQPWGCDYAHIQQTVAMLKKWKIGLLPVQAGNFLYDKDGALLEVLYDYNGKDTPIGKTDINDTSLILLFSFKGIKVLFPGDLNYPLGNYLSQKGERIEADILKVPHHGAERVAPNEFFDRVQPRLALVPAPQVLWLSERCKRVREYLRDKEIETFVNGLHGHVTVKLNKDGYTVSTPPSQ